MVMQATARRNLVVVRAGDQSLHPRWLAGATERSWDLLFNYFGDDPDKYRGGDVMRIDSKGPKWRALKQLIETHRDLFARYDYVWFPDDDIDCRGQDVNLLFQLADEYKLKLCQPSLSHRSFVSILLTLNNPLTTLRYTNFVEGMMPCFSRESLALCVDVMGDSVSGWGIDLIWPTLIGGVPGDIAVVDRVSVTHTRPIGGQSASSNYRHVKDDGPTAYQEMLAVCYKHGILDPYVEVTAVIVGGRVKLRTDKGFGKLLIASTNAATVAVMYGLRSNQRWDIHKYTKALFSPSRYYIDKKGQTPESFRLNGS